MWNYFYTLSYIYTVKKNRFVEVFSIPVVRDIGADYTSQIITVKIKVVKVERAKRTLSGLITIIFYWYYLTGVIRTYILNIAEHFMKYHFQKQ